MDAENQMTESKKSKQLQYQLQFKSIDAWQINQNLWMDFSLKH